MHWVGLWLANLAVLLPGDLLIFTAESIHSYLLVQSIHKNIGHLTDQLRIYSFVNGLSLILDSNIILSYITLCNIK